MVRDRGKAQAGQSTMEYLLVLLGVVAAVYVVGSVMIKEGLGVAGGTEGIFPKAKQVLTETGTRVVGDLNIPKQ